MNPDGCGKPVGDQPTELSNQSDLPSSYPHAVAGPDEFAASGQATRDDHEAVPGAQRSADKDDGGSERGAMRCICRACGKANDVLPPEGFGLVREEEAALWSREYAQPPSSFGHASLVEKLKRQLEA